MVDISTLGGAYTLPRMGGTCGCGEADGSGSPFEMLAKLLVQALLNDDGTLKDSKLAELLGKFMDEHTDKYGSPGQYGTSWRDALTSGQHSVDGDVLEQVLADMIGARLGNDSFADQLFSGRNAGNPLALFGQPGSNPFAGHGNAFGGDLLESLFGQGQPTGLPGTGGSDFIGQLMQFLSSLGSEALGGLLQKDGNGGARFSSEDMEMLKQVALYMDQNPDVFGQPHDANGKVRSWVDELGEDNYLNAEETALFEKAIGNIGAEMANFATVGNGSSNTGGLFGGAFDPKDISLNLGASTAAFNIMAQLFGASTGWGQSSWSAA